MAFANVIEIDSLLAEISSEKPQGADIREDRSPTSDYYTIKDARNSARAAERSAMFDDSDSDLLAPWREVAATAEKILRNHSKDLEVAAWYAEALIRLYGFSGLRDGFLLIGGLVEKYWDGLYPEPDEDGLESKVAPLTGLNGDGADGTLLLPIRSAEITPVGDFGGFTFFQYQQARDAEKIVDDDAKLARIEALGYSLADFDQSVSIAAPEWAQSLVETLDECLTTYKKLNESLRAHCGQDAPPSTSISSLLDEVLRTIRFIYKEKLESLNVVEDQSEPTENTEDAFVSASELAGTGAGHIFAVPGGAVTSREDALMLLERAAKYFRTYEPHTPLAPGLERLLSWGRMTVAELMSELLPDEHSRAMYSQLTGVKLDGSDSQRYIAPPKVTASSEPQQSSVEPAASSDSGAGSGWGEENKEPAETTGW